MQQRGDSQLRGSLQCGTAGKAPHPNGQIRLELAHDLLSLVHSLQHHHRQTQIAHHTVERLLPADAVNLQSLNGIARLRDATHLHFVTCPDKQYLRIGILCLDFIGNGQRRENMSTGAASADDVSLFHSTLVLNCKNTKTLAISFWLLAIIVLHET